MICQIIDSVDNQFGEYLWHFLVVRLYSWHNSKEPADCKLIHETVQHAELSQTRDAIRWHQAAKPKLFYWDITKAKLVSFTLLLLIAFIYRYSPLSSRLIALACDSAWVNSFLYSAFLNIHRSGVLTALAWLVPHETAAITSCKATYVRWMRV